MARPQKDVVVKIRTRTWARHVDAAARRISPARLRASCWEGRIGTGGVPLCSIVARLASSLNISYDESNPSRYLERAKKGMESSIQGRRIATAEAAIQIDRMPGLEGTGIWYTAPLWELLQGKLPPKRSLSAQIDKSLRAIGFTRLKIDEMLVETRPFFAMPSWEGAAARVVRDAYGAAPQRIKKSDACILERLNVLALLYLEATHVGNERSMDECKHALFGLMTSEEFAAKFGSDGKALREQIKNRVIRGEVLLANREKSWFVDRRRAEAAIMTADSAKHERQVAARWKGKEDAFVEYCRDLVRKGAEILKANDLRAPRG